MRKLLGMLLLAACVAALAACSATPTKPKDSASTVVYGKSEADVQKAATAALVANGFEVKKPSPGYIEGTRPRKVGLVVGSGGESAGVWLSPLGPNKTSVQVSTAKTFVGGAGQKKWDKEILSEMDKSVGPRE